MQEEAAAADDLLDGLAGADWMGGGGGGGGWVSVGELGPGDNLDDVLTGMATGAGGAGAGWLPLCVEEGKRVLCRPSPPARPTPSPNLDSGRRHRQLPGRSAAGG